MRKAKVYSAFVKGIFIQLKAYSREHALTGYRLIDESITLRDIRVLDVVNSHQHVWDE